MRRKVGVIMFICFWTLSGYTQDRMKVLAKFGVGLNLGYRTYNGIGPIVLYHPNRYFDVEFGLGYSGYNGGKFGGGLKFYPLNTKKVNPFIGLHYAITTGKHLKTAKVVDISTENYRTFPNHYAIGSIGFWVKGEQIQHQFSVGYAALLNPFRLEADSTNKLNEHRAEIEKNIKSGISFTYSILINLNKLDD